MSNKISAIPDLISLLDYRNRATRQKVAFEINGNAITFGQLWQGINGFAAYLTQIGIKEGECVLIALPNSAEFFPVFYGIQRAGGIPVPLFPNSGKKRIQTIANICTARFFVTLPGNKEIPDDITYIDPKAHAGEPPSWANITPDTIAYIQFTSGSTGDPKGVPITHAALLINMRQMIEGMEITADDVFVSWLPVYHDMGLIILTMIPFYLAARLILLPTSFVNLRRWLSTISEFRGTYTASPDFGYRLALRYASRASQYDLSSLRVAMNAAESARPDTIASFESTFGLHNVMTVGYGLAEATVGVSMTSPEKGVRIDADGYASVGVPFPDVEIKILAENGQYVETGQPGEVIVKSPALTSGYYLDPESTADLFTEKGFLKTGDIGYLDEQGELFIIGRQKEMIKHTGRTLSPREIEAALDSYPGLREVAAFSVDFGGLSGEQAVVVAEVGRPASLAIDDMHSIAVDIVASVHANIGIRPARVYIAKPHTIPQTANGKIQRSLLREQFKDGSLQSSGMLLYPDY